VTEIELSPPVGNVADAVESVAADLGLKTAIRISLKKYPGSIHWHFSSPGQRGTLECTWWPDGNRLWLAIHANRKGDWQPAATAEFRRVLAATRSDSSQMGTA